MKLLFSMHSMTTFFENSNSVMYLAGTFLILHTTSVQKKIHVKIVNNTCHSSLASAHETIAAGNTSDTHKPASGKGVSISLITGEENMRSLLITTYVLSLNLVLMLIKRFSTLILLHQIQRLGAICMRQNL